MEKKLSNLYPSETLEQIVSLFLLLKTSTLLSSSGKVHISLRNLSRALNFIKANISLYGGARTLYDGLYLGFGSSLDTGSLEFFENNVEKLFGKIYSEQNYQKIFSLSSNKYAKTYRIYF